MDTEGGVSLKKKLVVSIALILALLSLGGGVLLSYAGSDTAWTFIGSSSDTRIGGGGGQDGRTGFGIRNENLTPGNYAFLCFQSIDTTGQVYCGAEIAAVFERHEVEPGNKFTVLKFYLQGEHIDALNEAMRLQWDRDQNGPCLALWTLCVRQGLNMDRRLPIAWIGPNGERLLSLKYGDTPNTLQIGDNFSGDGFDYTIRAPIVAPGNLDKRGGNFVFQAGAGTGLGAGGCIQFATAPAGTVSSGASNPAVKTVQICGNDIIVDGVSFKSLEARVAALEARQ